MCNCFKPNQGCHCAVCPDGTSISLECALWVNGALLLEQTVTCEELHKVSFFIDYNFPVILVNSDDGDGQQDDGGTTSQNLDVPVTTNGVTGDGIPVEEFCSDLTNMEAFLAVKFETTFEEDAVILRTATNATAPSLKDERPTSGSRACFSTQAKQGMSHTRRSSCLDPATTAISS
jgi:hypothetical protein